MSVHVLPLAITMMAGPQIISAIIFVTAERAIRLSLAFLAGVLTATVAGLAIARAVAELLGSAVHLGDSQHRGGAGRIIELALVVLLLLLALKNYLGRETAEPPGWLTTLLTATPLRAVATGLLVILAMPSDIIVLLTVGLDLKRSHAGLADAAPFVAATLVIAALPLLAYLSFRRRAERAMPRIRDWLDSHSWLVNMIACFVFIALILI
ncbi:GAP family protein [Actinoallomurus purpureus]|uniref:GAP family protein n=1 Tax=Actinoallomurus purpureus TaxID=478114 RepID=UPI0020929070|nr:GAP family protein [Actinoallomurus purpureus]MCO6009399.1 GAP family protein [Actinoallomurus purpureus]